MTIYIFIFITVIFTISYWLETRRAAEPTNTIIYKTRKLIWVTWLAIKRLLQVGRFSEILADKCDSTYTNHDCSNLATWKEWYRGQYGHKIVSLYCDQCMEKHDKRERLLQSRGQKTTREAIKDKIGVEDKKNVWIVFHWQSIEANGNLKPTVVGVFDNQKKAEAACITDLHYIFPQTMNKALNTTAPVWHSTAYYPHNAALTAECMADALAQKKDKK